MVVLSVLYEMSTLVRLGRSTLRCSSIWFFSARHQMSRSDASLLFAKSIMRSQDRFSVRAEKLTRIRQCSFLSASQWRIVSMAGRWCANCSRRSKLGTISRVPSIDKNLAPWTKKKFGLLRVVLLRKLLFFGNQQQIAEKEKVAFFDPRTLKGKPYTNVSMKLNHLLTWYNVTRPSLMYRRSATSKGPLWACEAMDDDDVIICNRKFSAEALNQTI